MSAKEVQTAKSAGLVYVTDKSPGFRRIGTRKVFRYLDTKGHVIRNQQTLRRLQHLTIPPAWVDVWICPNPDGHLQAVGRDARGRKQYRYHSQWRETRDENKFSRMAAFGKALPRIRRRVARDLREKQLTRNKVLATIVRLLETTFIRVGNEEYAKQNNSFGLTTLRDRHVKVHGSQVQFYFRGKSGVKQIIDIENVRLAKIVRQLRDLPGYELFQYYDEQKELHSVGSADVNQYLRETAGEEFTAKDFRTWAGTMIAAEALTKCVFRTAKQAQQNVKAAIETTASRLGNTVAVRRKCYVHPAILDGYVEGSFPANGRARADERAVLRFLSRASLSETVRKRKPRRT